MNENAYPNSDEIVIDLADMFFFLLKKWRVLLVCLLIGALLGSGLGYMKSGQLTEEDIKDEVMFDMTRATQFYELAQKQKEYNDNSLLMQMDPNNMYYGRLQYHIRADAELNLVRARYTTLLQEDLKQEVGSAAGYGVELKYLDEIIASWAELITDDRGDNSTATLNVYFQVTSDSKEKCEAMLSVIREAAAQLEAELDKKYDDFECVPMTDSISQHGASAYLDLQEENIQRQNDYLTQIEKIEQELSDEEIYFYKTQLCGIVPEEEPTIVMGIIKWIIIGAFLGGVLWGVWYLVAYFMNKTIKTASEAMELCGVPLLGRLQDTTKNYKGLDKLIHNIQEGGKREADSLPYLVSLIEGMQYGNAVLCGNRRAPEVVAIMDAVQAVCPGIQGSSFIAVSADALRQAKADGQEILLVRTYRTKKHEIQRELNLCKHQGIKLLGLIVVD